jgi:hypothetical protein
MTEPEQNASREDSDQWSDDEASRTSMEESDTSPISAPDPQPGRSAVSNRGEGANPTGVLGQSDYPVDG